MDLIRVEHASKKYKQWARVEWNLGRRCNFDCSYCGADLHDNTSKHMPIEKFEYAIKSIREFYSDKQIRMSLTGGEPFVRKDFVGFLEMLSFNDLLEAIVGCTDSNACNYNLNATESCSDCCTYIEGCLLYTSDAADE
mgnify:CR=1 FL=1